MRVRQEVSGLSAERLLRQLQQAKARLPSASVTRDSTFEARHGNPAAHRQAGSRPNVTDDGPRGDNENHPPLDQTALA